MTLLAPLYLAVALAAAVGAVILHFIVTRQPPSQPLPTARFVPEGDAAVPTMARRPDDPLLLLLRVCLLLVIGAAFARPVLRPARVPVYRIVAVDSGSISAALVGALRTAAWMRDHADSLELSIVSPLTTGAFDAATDSIRTLWPGAIQLVRAAAPRTDSAPTPAVVHWPADGHAPGTVARAVPDTVGAVVAAGVAVVAPFERRWRLDRTEGRVIARWVDGEPAAVQQGCERDVAVAVPTAGDVVLRLEYLRFEHAMRAPCGGTGTLAADASAIDALRGHGPVRVAAHAVRSDAVPPVPLLPWLLGVAFLLAVAEIVVRRRGATL
ncbi:MAG TPA: BatA domain-containing protein [Gemmatimonadaceae bacterium]|jgi:hypothetical protein|nr:BatA domain-containing protein [Gemmatimonadaceae bacterium]